MFSGRFLFFVFSAILAVYSVAVFRMYLKSLEVSGFKSFAKKIQLVFKAPITAIVGPNGSGKSNVAEAFRFVLGEQSMKSMRGRRTEDLIWNGSRTVPKSNRASVKLTFDNLPRHTAEGTKRLFDIDFDEVLIERVIHRDASSEYHLNGSAVRLKDIVELLSGAHIGASGHHIISQGEADRILSVNPRERRAMIEDALGLKIYQYKKEESQRKLEKTDENLEKAESIRREIKPHLTFLGKQVAKIEKAQELAGELVKNYQEYFARETLYVERRKSELAEQKQPLEARMKELETSLAEARATLQKLEKKDVATTDLLSIEEDLRLVRQEKDGVAEEVGRIEGEIMATNKQLDRERERQAQGEKATIPLSAFNDFAGVLQNEIGALEEEHDLARIRETLRGLKERVLAFVARFTAADGPTDDIEGLKEELAVLQREREKVLARRKELEVKEAKRAEEYRIVQQKIEDDRDSGRELERNVFTLSNEQQETRLALQTITGQEDALRLEEEELKRELGEAGALAGMDAVRFKELMPKFADAMRSEDRHEQQERKRVVERMKIRLEDSGLSGSEDLMKEYRDVSERDAFLDREITDLTASAESLRTLIQELNEKLANEFEEGVHKINTEFATFFSIMFGGGDASLVIVKEKPRKSDVARMFEDDDMPELAPERAEEDGETHYGVEIHVSLPRKKIRGLEMLSGGERALTSIALIFAMSQVNPPPFVILDETDAALDEANSKRYGDMIENLAQRTQLILITHNRETMSRAGVLYGVTMGADATSQILSVSFTEAEQVAK